MPVRRARVADLCFGSSTAVRRMLWAMRWHGSGAPRQAHRQPPACEARGQPGLCLEQLCTRNACRSLIDLSAAPWPSEHRTHRSSTSDCVIHVIHGETVGPIFLQSEKILGIVADAALLSARRADRLTALTLATMVMASWGWLAQSRLETPPD